MELYFEIGNKFNGCLNETRYLHIMWLSDYKDEREINCDNLLINDIITIHTNSLNKIILNKHEK